MFERYFRQQIVQLLEKAGIGVDGRQPYDMIVHDQRLFQRILSSGNLGLGEAFMEGWWDCPELDDFFSGFSGPGSTTTWSPQQPYLAPLRENFSTSS